jgi:hypothetical protein
LPVRLPRPRRSGVCEGPQPLRAVAATVYAGKVYDGAYRVVGRRASLPPAGGWRLAAGRVLRENGIEAIGEYLENKLVDGAHRRRAACSRWAQA